MLDIQSEVNPPEVLQYIATCDMGELSSQDRNKLRYFEAKCLLTMHRPEEIEAIVVECISLAIPEKDYFILVNCNVLLGICYSALNQEIGSRPSLDIALEYAIQSADYELIIYASSFLLSHLRQYKSYQEALKEEKRTVDLLKRVNPSYIALNALNKIATLNMELFKLEESATYLRQALQYAQSLGLPDKQLTIINNLSSVYIRLLNYSKAEELLLAGLKVAQESVHEEQISLMLLNLGNLKMCQKNFSAAQEYFEQCYNIVEKYGDKISGFTMDLFSNYAMCCSHLQEHQKALLYINRAIKLSQDFKMLPTEHLFQLNKANALLDLEEYEEAKGIINNAIKYYKKEKHYVQWILATRTLAKLYAKQHNYKKSYEISERANDISGEYVIDIQRKRMEQESGTVKLRELNLDSISSETVARPQTAERYHFIGNSVAHQNVLNAALLAAQHPNTSVMIMGESGTGKEVIAQIIHNNSIRRNSPFVSVNIGALSASLIESELFGHTKGAYTGADTQTKGFFLQADKGSLFLDEITEMPFELQSKLLRVIETRNVTPVGSSREVPFDSRIITATNLNLRAQMFSNKFRLDLFHRLNTIEIHIPPLRERTEDIEPLILHFISCFAKELKKHQPMLDKSFLDAMKQHSFPGNVRELKNIIERMFIFCNSNTWDAKLLGQINPFSFNIETPADNQCQDEEELIVKALIKAKGKQKDAAQLLNVSEATIYRRIVKYNLQKYTRKGH
jgi:DNA-binding NtrC family response regulator